jgi:hypothetical protein
MAAPQDSPEQAVRLRKFAGTNTDIDSTFLGPSLVSLSENWIPTQSYRLGKRPGTSLVQRLWNGVTAITDLVLARDATHSYLYAYCQRASAPDIIAVLVDEQPVSFDPPNIVMTTQGALGRLVLFRDRVYCGNGVDPLVSWVVGGASTTVQRYAAMGATTTTGSQVIAIDNPAGAATDAMPTGSYAYAWGVIDTTSGLYVSRSASAQLAIGTGANSTGQRLSTTAPTAALPAGQAYRFFIAVRNYPIEYATAQGANYAAGEARTYSSIDVSDLRCPISSGVMRTGNVLLVWRNRIVFAGPQAPERVYATDTILPGLEQQTYNQGTFFPVNAVVPLPDACTGLGLAGVTTDRDPNAPLVFFTLTRTFICQGDPFSTIEQASLVEVSSRIGCIGHGSIVNTPAGTIFCGLDSVYLVPPGGGYPQDVGWPIANQIRTIPPGLRDRIVATFHKQFYKLAIPQSGQATNTDQWWLDVRQGIGDTPSWWGPQRGYSASAFTTDIESAQEIDRGYAAYANSDIVVRTHQTTSYSDFTAADPVAPIVSRLRSGRFDADQPFVVKIFTRLRLIAQTFAKSAIQVTFTTDAGVSWQIDPIILGEGMEDPGQFVHLVPTAPPPPTPNRCWNTAHFGSMSPVEVQTITPYTRPRGLSAIVTLTHGPRPEDTPPTSAVANVELRDFELLFLLSERKVRFVGERISK